MIEEQRPQLFLLLDESFRFYPREVDLDRFPWLEGALYWDRGTEEGILTRMFADSDPLSVDSIELKFNVLAVAQLAEATSWAVDVEALLEVLTGPGEGWFADSRLEIIVVDTHEGEDPMKVSIVRELDAGRSAGPLEEDSWAGIWGRFAQDPESCCLTRNSPANIDE
jgi:hypothetical protein